MPDGIQVGEAYVRIRPDTRGFDQQLTKDAESAGRKASDVLSGVLGAAAFAAGAKRIVDAASGLEQAVGGTKAVFGESAAAVEDFASRSAEAAGLSERAAREATSQIGGLLKGFGFTKDEAAGLSVQLTQLGADLAATFGGTPTEAVTALGAALRGEFDPLERFGISLNVTQSNLKAVELGLAESTNEVSQNAKAQGALALIMERSADAQGQFARESDTAAGQMARAQANFEDTAAAIGENLLPAVTVLSSILGGVARGFGELPGPMQAAAIAAVGLSVAAKALGVKDLATLKTALQAIPIAATAAAVGLAASLYAYDELAKRQRAAAEAADDLRGKIREKIDTSTYEDVRAQYDRIVAGIQDIDQTVANSRAPWDQDYRNELTEYRNGLAAAANEVAGVINRSDELARAAGTSSAAAFDFFQRMQAGGVEIRTTEQAVSLFQAGISSLELAQLAAARATDDGGEALKNYVSALGDALSAQEDVEGANKDVASAQREVNDLAAEYADVARDQRSAQLDLIDAQERLIDLQNQGAENDRSRRGSLLDVRSAELDLKDAQDEAAKATPEDRERALLRLEQAQLRLEEAQARVAEVEEGIADQGREIERARLDVANAEDSVREARERGLDLPRQQAEAENELTKALVNQYLAQLNLAAQIQANPDLVRLQVDAIQGLIDQQIISEEEGRKMQERLFLTGLTAIELGKTDPSVNVDAPGLNETIGKFETLIGLLNSGLPVGTRVEFQGQKGTFLGPGFAADANQPTNQAQGGFAPGGRLSEVSEFAPEVFDVGGRRFLIPQAGGGNVRPLSNVGGSSGGIRIDNLTINGARSEDTIGKLSRELDRAIFLLGV